MIDSVSSKKIQQQAPASGQRANAAKGQFGAVFQQELARSNVARQIPQQAGVAFSKHAVDRVEERGIQVDDQLLSQLSDSVEKAQAKGATNILAFDATRAFIINVPNNRVITAMTQEEMKENVFTNIDGAVIL